jgi:preprotein translocase subunit SecF
MMTDVTQQDSKKYGRPDDERVIDFMKIALPAAILSIVLTIGSLFFIFTKGLNLGLDFTGGISAELNYSKPVKSKPKLRPLVKIKNRLPMVKTIERMAAGSAIFIKSITRSSSGRPYFFESC